MTTSDDQFDEERMQDLVLARDLGSISDAEHQELETILRKSKAARQLYLRLCSDTAVLHGQAHEDVESLLAPQKDSSPTAAPRTNRRILAIASIGWAAAAVLIAALLLNRQTQRGPLQIEDSAVAILAAAPEAVWDATETRPKIGSRLSPSILRIEKGCAQIEFYSGASVVIEGPAELELIDAMTAKLTKGRLHGQAPKLASGFTVHTPNGKVVDLGTAFGIDLTSPGICEVHVMEGEIAVHTSSTTDHHLKAGESISYTAAGAISEIPSNPAKFLGPAQLATIIRTDAERKLTNWSAYSKELRQSPGLLVYYDFQDQLPWERSLTNKVNSDVSQGSIIGAQWVEGRWPGKQALALGQISDRIRLHVPGELENATFATWIRFDSFDNWLSSLLLTHGWSNGEAHWHVTWEGESILGLGGRAEKQPHHNYYTPAQVIDTNAAGRWVHLVCTYDAQAREVVQYVDGVIVGRETTISANPIIIGDAAIGNWSSIDRSKRDVRQINGRIDEFAIFNRALSQAEVLNMYNAGNPY